MKKLLLVATGVAVTLNCGVAFAAREDIQVKATVGSFLTLAALFLMVLNWFRFGDVLESGYGTAQSAFSFDYLQRDFIDYLISLDRGLFPYSPLLLVALLGFREFFKRDKKYC